MAFLGAGLLPAAAFADPPLPVLEQAGQLGRWATVSCEAPVSQQNMHMVYYDAGKGLVRRRLERGHLPALDGAIDSARTVRSVASNGTVFIRDGKFENGSPVPTMIRCDR